MTYEEFIQNILNKRSSTGCGNAYHEKHHIVPRCLGGTNDKKNLVDLYAKEHYIAHKLLAEENPENASLQQAYNIMAFTYHNKNLGEKLTPEEYEAARLAVSKALKEKYKDPTNHPCYGKHISEERKQLISRINTGNKYCVGRMLSEETKKKIGDANRNPSNATRKKMSESQKARNLNGKNNPRAKKVIRLNDMKIYDCAIDAAQENQITYSTFKARLQKKNEKWGFLYYEDYLLTQ